MTDAARDQNRVATLLAVDSADGTTPIPAEITASTGRLRVDSLPTGAYDTFLQDAYSEAIVTVGFEHHELHEGDHYFVTSYADLAINHVLQFSWQMPNTAKWTNWTWNIETEAETLWQVYEGGTISVALSTAITPLNSNRNSANTSGTTMRYEDHANLAAANTSIDVSGATLLASGISGAGKLSGGNAKRENELILKQNTLYVLRATATVAGFVDFNMNWYEHTASN